MISDNEVVATDSKSKITTSEYRLLTANNQYLTNGNHNYFVNDCFRNTDIILPVDMLTETGQSDEAKRMKDLCDKIDNMSMSTMHSDKLSRSNSSSSQTNQQGTPNFSAIMMKRWESHNQNLPSLDQADIAQDCPLITQVEANEETVSQHAPEFSQVAYLRLRSIEEVFSFKNYLEPKCNPEFANFLKNNRKARSIVQYNKGRAQGMDKILDLHAKKGYRLESLFAAQNIFDRYLSMVGHWNFTEDKYILLATISVLMSAKLEQDTSPSFNRMISLLSNRESKMVSKQALVDLEYDIILRFGCDFNFPGPVETLERFLRVVGYHKNDKVVRLSREILRQQIKCADFLNYRPSQVAAATVLVAINMFQNCELTDMSLWNNEKIIAMTGYSTEMLKAPIEGMAEFVKYNKDIISSALQDA